MSAPTLAYIGAGGAGFPPRLFTDLISHPALREMDLRMMDIDAGRLDVNVRFAEHVVKQQGYGVTVTGTTDRAAALDGADFVISSLGMGSDCYYHDIMIPRKYGVDQGIGDTLGPGGVFRALRTTPMMLDIARDIERLCPDAWVLNYTNPMVINCRAMRKATRAKVIGLCHSVQGTAGQLAGYIGKPFEEMSYWVAGINHMSWFLELKWQGQDAYPLLWETLHDPNTYAKDTVRFEIMKHFDYFVTESTPHMSEYTPWFRKRPEVRESFGLDTRDIKPDASDHRWEGYAEKVGKQIAGEEPIDLNASHEYGSYIINGIVTGVPFRFNGNVPNTGLIANLPADSVVEVPCLVDSLGVHPCAIGALPTQLAAMNLSNLAVQELTVDAILEGDRRKAFQAICLDPLTAAVCSLAEIRQMVDEMFAAEEEWLP